MTIVQGGIHLQFYYGQQMPLRILDEAEFWKHQEEEHTVVIRELASNLEEKYVNALKEWEKALSETHKRVIRFIETVIRSKDYVSTALYQQVWQLVSFCLKQSLDFIKLCQQIKTESAAVSTNPTAKVVLDHIIRESEYFVGIAQALLYHPS
jgi:predicted TIM-barrel fold metal-dependent hydrolase